MPRIYCASVQACTLFPDYTKMVDGIVVSTSILVNHLKYFFILVVTLYSSDMNDFSKISTVHTYVQQGIGSGHCKMAGLTNLACFSQRVVNVCYHCGGWSEEVNSCILISYIVYL
jgi:hypothetical protein